jgi:hypothetical protein
MQLGFFTMPIHPLGKDWRQCLREDQEAFLLADELGFTEGYAGEHVTDLAENITSCVVFLASLAGRVKNMRLGTGTVNIPNSHPAAVAGQQLQARRARHAQHAVGQVQRTLAFDQRLPERAAKAQSQSRQTSGMLQSATSISARLRLAAAASRWEGARTSMARMSLTALTISPFSSNMAR